jgi:hypothetical protein
MRPAPLSLRFDLYRLCVFVIRAISGITVLASRIVCLIVLAWFVVFAVGQSSTAATNQVDKLASGTSHPLPRPAPAKEGSAKKTLGEAAKAITSPFSALTSGMSSAWLSHGVNTLLALLVYGFGVGFLVRLIRLRI